MPLQFPIPPGYIEPPIDGFQFALLFLAGVELLVLTLPPAWQDALIDIALHLPPKKT